MKKNKYGVTEYVWSSVNKHVGYAKVFGTWNYGVEGKPRAMCQIKGCVEEAKWAVELVGKGDIILCFEHGEDAKPKKLTSLRAK